MHIEIHLFPDHFPIDPLSWAKKVTELNRQVNDFIVKASVNRKAYAIGKTTLLADDDSDMVVATIDIRRE